MDRGTTGSVEDITDADAAALRAEEGSGSRAEVLSV